MIGVVRWRTKSKGSSRGRTGKKASKEEMAARVESKMVTRRARKRADRLLSRRWTAAANRKDEVAAEGEEPAPFTRPLSPLKILSKVVGDE